MKERTGYFLSGMALGVIAFIIGGVFAALPTLVPSVYGDETRLYISAGVMALLGIFFWGRTLYYTIKDWHDFDS
ncbi:MAG: hypothetical protein OQK24_10610 [Magnetovibrio sp.]|nr:hypothetical protein [Magnetovibrio sp.]